MASKGVRVEMNQKKLSDAVAGKKTVYPSILKLDEGDLKAVKDWKIGETYTIELEAKLVKSSSKGDLAPPDDSDANLVHCEFEVSKVKEINDKEKINE